MCVYIGMCRCVYRCVCVGAYTFACEQVCVEVRARVRVMIHVLWTGVHQRSLMDDNKYYSWSVMERTDAHACTRSRTHLHTPTRTYTDTTNSQPHAIIHTKANFFLCTNFVLAINIRG